MLSTDDINLSRLREYEDEAYDIDIEEWLGLLPPPMPAWYKRRGKQIRIATKSDIDIMQCKYPDNLLKVGDEFHYMQGIIQHVSYGQYRVTLFDSAEKWFTGYGLGAKAAYEQAFNYRKKWSND